MSQVELRDVEGPSALGGGWRRSLELLYLIAAFDFKRHYLGTALGYVWSIARPLMLFGVLLAVFTQVFRLGSEVPHYPVLLLFNIVLFCFFQEATGIAVTSITAQEGIVRKTQFPRLVIPLAVVLTSLFNLGLNLVVVLVFVLAFGVTPNASRKASTAMRFNARLNRLVSTTASGTTSRGNCVLRIIGSWATSEVTATPVASWKKPNSTMLNSSSTG